MKLIERLRRKVNNSFGRDDFVIEQLYSLPGGSRILDAGCGSQRYRTHCSHLKYFTQDFGQYTSDERIGMTASFDYKYGPLDYVGNIWNICEKDGYFDAILCTEVFEHIPFPVETLKEFARLLRPGGTLILTAPANCLRHMDPYFFFSGFSDRFYEKFIAETGFTLKLIKPVGDYYSWILTELVRTARAKSLLAKFAIAPAALYFGLKKPTEESVNTLCEGYHVVATRNHD